MTILCGSEGHNERRYVAKEKQSLAEAARMNLSLSPFRLSIYLFLSSRKSSTSYSR